MIWHILASVNLSDGARNMTTFRTAAERLSRNRVLLRHINVMGKREPLLVSPDAQLKYLKLGSAAFDTDLIALAEQWVKPGFNVWDVGANVGTFFVAAASRTGTEGSVIAIEADPWLASLLDRTTQLPSHKQREMLVLCAAASASFGSADFLVAARGRASNALAEVGGRGQMGGVRYKKPVVTLPLDHLLERYPKPDFIKIDVEGAEELVLEGMAKTLSEVRPTLYCEVGSDQFEAISVRMQSNGYVLKTVEGDTVTTHCRENYLLVPT
jgi:FkbM family methyltransferase